MYQMRYAIIQIQFVNAMININLFILGDPFGDGEEMYLQGSAGKI